MRRRDNVRIGVEWRLSFTIVGCRHRRRQSSGLGTYVASCIKVLSVPTCVFESSGFVRQHLNHATACRPRYLTTHEFVDLMRSSWFAENFYSNPRKLTNSLRQTLVLEALKWKLRSLDSRSLTVKIELRVIWAIIKLICNLHFYLVRVYCYTITRWLMRVIKKGKVIMIGLSGVGFFNK